jgi:HEAT repeat protein
MPMADSRPLPPAIARRREVALAGHQGDEARARAGLADDDPGVRATALGALTRIGVLTIDELRRASTDAAPAVRVRVAEVLPAVGDPTAAHGLLRALLADSEATVVEVAAWASGEITPSSTQIVADLSAIATEHDDPLAREAAVAALGSIGDSGGLAAILAATTDKPAIRRRAVLALAPFEGPDVDAALEHAKDDRDWQVRQAAEDLLS